MPPFALLHMYLSLHAFVSIVAAGVTFYASTVVEEYDRLVLAVAIYFAVTTFLCVLMSYVVTCWEDAVIVLGYEQSGAEFTAWRIPIK